MKQVISKIAITALALVFTSACTKSREAMLPDSEVDSVFAISDFGTLDVQKSTFQVKTSAQAEQKNNEDAAKARSEKSSLQIAPETLQVPQRLKFMFSGLEMTGEAGQNYKLVFAVDRDFVTAYKVIDQVHKMSLIEQELAVFASQVEAEIEMQKTIDSTKLKNLKDKALAAKSSKDKAVSQKTSSTYLVPLFKFKVEGFGILQRNKNELREETAVLSLKNTEFSEATHIKISSRSSARLTVDVDPADKETLEEIFVAERVHQQKMTAGQMYERFKVKTNLDANTQVYTLISGNLLTIYEVLSSKDQLSEAQQRILQSESGSSQVMKCPEAINKEQKECYLLRKLEYAVEHVRPKQKEVSWEGTRSHTVSFEALRPRDSVGLVRIPKNAAAQSSALDDKYDPQTLIKIEDVANKEFFFRRTALAASTTADAGVGLATPVMIVKFDLQDQRAVLKRVERIIDFRMDKRELDLEDILSYPVKYFKLTYKDASGNTLPTPLLEPTTRQQATHFKIDDWAKSSIPQHYSAFSYYIGGSCLSSINDRLVKDVDLRLNEGIFNFSIEYSYTMNPACVRRFSFDQDYSPMGNHSSDLTQKAVERVSLMVNDGRTDKGFAPSIPFPAQNALGFDFFTTNLLNPSQHGEIGRDGQEKTFLYHHDFRNGRVLEYLIGGLPEKEGRYVDLGDQKNVDLRQLYIDITQKTVADWNKALHRAFKGTSLERKGPYIVAHPNGENGKTGQLGDLDKNFIWYENTVDDGGSLGISMNGVNPRSGVSVSDFLVMYGGNYRAYVTRLKKNHEILKNKKDLIAKIIAENDQALQKQKQESSKKSQPQAETQASNGSDKTQSPQTQDSKPSQQINQLLDTKTNYFERVAQALTGKSDKKSTLNEILKMSKMQKIKKQDFDFGQKKKMSSLQKTQVESLLGEKAIYQNIAERVMSLGSGANEKDIELISLEEIYKNRVQNSDSHQYELAELHGRIQKLRMKAQTRAFMSKQPTCSFPSQDVLIENFEKVSVVQAFEGLMMGTLAHEMGHSLGLTHNFIGSTDASNFMFEDETKPTRVSSTVMEYQPPQDDFFYEGPGPYDVFAIRAGYTGLIPMKGRNEIHVDEVKAKLGQSWLNVTSKNAQSLEIKKFLYCTDKDVGDDALCERHDSGRNAVEVVRAIRQSYLDNYTLRYHGYDRLRYDQYNSSAGYNRSISIMQDARKFMDEFFYKIITSSEAELSAKDEASLLDAKFAGLNINDPEVLKKIPSVGEVYKQAATEAYNFFLEIIYTPELITEGTRYTDAQRFVPLTKDGQTIVVETKSTRDLEEHKDRLDTLGIEIDKVYSLIMLTQKGMPDRRFSTRQLYLSFAEFERYGLEIEDPTKSPLLGTLADILTEGLRPKAYIKGEFVDLPNELKVEITASMRSYAAVRAVLALESQTLQDKNNLANLFKVRTVIGKPPEDRISIMKVGTTAQTSQTVNYVALDGAEIAQLLINAVANVNAVLNPNVQLQAAVTKLFKAQSLLKMNAQNQANEELKKAVLEAKSQIAEVLKQMGHTKDTMFIGAEQLKDDPYALAAELIYQLTDIYTRPEFVQITNEVAKILKAQQEGQTVTREEQEKVIGKLNSLKSALTQTAQKFVLLPVAQMILLKMAQSEKLVPLSVALAMTATFDREMSNRAAITTKSVEFLSQLTRISNPEYTQ